VTVSARLIFVYNAEAGLAAGLIDSVHKLVSPATYPCSLCAVTYGMLTMQPAWRRFLKGLPYAVVFHHRADFRAAYPAAADMRLPLIALDSAGGLETLLDAAMLDALPDLDALIAQLAAILPPRDPPAPTGRA